MAASSGGAGGQVTPCEPLVSSLLQNPPPPLSACGAPPLRNHSICVPYSLIAVISQTQSHPLLSNKFLWNKVTLQAVKRKYKYETMNCCGVHSKALNGRGHGTAQHRVNRIIE